MVFVVCPSLNNRLPRAPIGQQKVAFIYLVQTQVIATIQRDLRSSFYFQIRKAPAKKWPNGYSNH
jgi:hypothetical protein